MHASSQCLKYAPVVLVVFSAIAVFAVFARGSVILKPIQHFFEERGVPAGTFFTGLIVVVVLVTCGFMTFILRQEWAETQVEEYRYCKACDAVDNYEDGICPICHAPLQSTARFIRVSPSDSKVLSSLKIKPCQHAFAPSPQPEFVSDET